MLPSLDASDHEHSTLIVTGQACVRSEYHCDRLEYHVACEETEYFYDCERATQPVCPFRHSHVRTSCSLPFPTQVPPSKKPRMKLQCLENINAILAWLKRKGVRLENIGGEDVYVSPSPCIESSAWCEQCSSQRPRVELVRMNRPMQTLRDAYSLPRVSRVSFHWCISSSYPLCCAQRL